MRIVFVGHLFFLYIRIYSARVQHRPVKEEGKRKK